jgi:tRNA (guanine-N7-)-methyltransferase
VTFLELRDRFRVFKAVEIEIGCGNGHFLADYAERNPEIFLIGLELKSRRCARAEEKARKRGLVNVAIVKAGAEGFIRDIPASSVDAFHIYFPDPWPKTRHRKRRFLSRENLGVLASCLKCGGRLFFSTDFLDYYVQTKVLLLLGGGFTLAEDPHPEEAFISIYSRKLADAGRAIHLITAVKIGETPGGAFIQ